MINGSQPGSGPLLQTGFPIPYCFMKGIWPGPAGWASGRVPEKPRRNRGETAEIGTLPGLVIAPRTGSPARGTFRLAGRPKMWDPDAGRHSDAPEFTLNLCIPFLFHPHSMMFCCVPIALHSGPHAFRNARVLRPRGRVR